MHANIYVHTTTCYATICCTCSVSIRQHTSTYVGIRQHTSVYVSTRQHTSTYVKIHACYYMLYTQFAHTCTKYFPILHIRQTMLDRVMGGSLMKKIHCGWSPRKTGREGGWGWRGGRVRKVSIVSARYIVGKRTRKSRVWVPLTRRGDLSTGV